MALCWSYGESSDFRDQYEQTNDKISLSGSAIAARHAADFFVTCMIRQYRTVSCYEASIDSVPVLPQSADAHRSTLVGASIPSDTPHHKCL